MHRVLHLSALCVILAYAPLRAQAQESSQSESDRAMQLAQEGKLEEAIEVWLNLKEMLLPTDPELWKIHRNIGRSFQKLKLYPEAWWHLQRALWLDKEQAGKAAEWIEQVEKELAAQGHVKTRLEVRAPGASVVIPHGSKERSFGTPLEWWFKPGKHVVKAKAPGFLEASKTIEIAASGNLEPIVLEKAEAPGVLVINVPYSTAKVWVDGSLVGEGSVERTLPAGPHAIEVRYGDQVLTKKSVVVQSGRTTVEVVNPAVAGGESGGSSSGSTVWPWVAAGSAVALGLAGGGLFWKASSNLESGRNEFAEAHNLPLPSVTAAQAAELQRDWDGMISSDVTPYTTGAYVMWGLAGVAAVTSVILFVTGSSDRNEAQSSWYLTPALMPDGAGIGFVWVR